MKVVRNAELERLCEVLRLYYGHADQSPQLRLYRNDLPLTEELVTTDFVEANFIGYAPISLVDEWGAPVKSSDGVWSARTRVFTFPAPAVDPGNRIFGAFVTVNSEWVSAESFAAAIDVLPGGVGFSLRGLLTLRDDRSYEVGIEEV